MPPTTKRVIDNWEEVSSIEPYGDLDFMDEMEEILLVDQKASIMEKHKRMLEKDRAYY